MKKVIFMLLILAMCCGLCACSTEAEIVLPTKPQQMAVPSLPARAPQNDEDAASEGTESAEPTGDTYPWEGEFREEDYDRFEGVIENDADIITWKENGFMSQTRRKLTYWHNGDIEDTYYYPSGNISHSYWYGADGTYWEAHYLDNGYIEIDGNSSMMYTGTNIYFKEIYPDGSYREHHRDNDGTPTFSIELDANGVYTECRYYKNGNYSKIITSDPVSGTYQEEEYYENGNMKYIKNQTPENTVEEQYDEEGYHTYFYSKNADWEIELTADETGKLIRVVENGETIEDPERLAQYAQGYN